MLHASYRLSHAARCLVTPGQSCATTSESNLWQVPLSHTHAACAASLSHDTVLHVFVIPVKALHMQRSGQEDGPVRGALYGAHSGCSQSTFAVCTTHHVLHVSQMA